MAKEFGRPQRLADYLRKELALIIRREVRDPRLSQVSVTDAEVSRDLSHAKVFVTFFDQSEAADIKQSLKVLNNAAGFLRMQIAKESTLRIIPTLRFHYDESIRRGSDMSLLIEQARNADRVMNPDLDADMDNVADEEGSPQ